MIEMYAGDTLYITIPITDGGIDVDLTGSTIEWSFADVIKTVGNGITISGSQAEIKLFPADTSNKSGLYRYKMRITDAQGNVSTVNMDGRLYVR